MFPFCTYKRFLELEQLSSAQGPGSQVKPLWG